MSASLRTNRLRTPIALLGLLPILLGSAVQSRAETPEIPPSSVPASSPLPKWKVADSWFVNLWTKNAQGTEEKYDMHIIFAGVNKRDNVDCCRFEFIPLQAPKEAEISYSVFYEIGSGKIKTVLSRKDWADIPIMQIEGTKLPGPMSGFPLEVLPVLAPGESVPTPDSTLLVTRKEEPGAKVWRASLTRNGKEELAIQQTWKDDSRWWSKYERFKDGQPELVCAIATAPTPLASAPEPPQPPVTPEAMLRADPRLQVLMTESFQGPTLPALLERLAKVTGVPLRTNIEDKTTVLYYSMGVNETPACELIIRIADTKAGKGTWEKDGDGYQLVSNQPTGSALTTEAKSTSSRKRWLWAAGLATLTVVLVSAWLLLRRPKATPQQTSTENPV